MKKIIIIGGGYGGIKALETLSKSNQDIEVTLIDQHAFHYLQTESYNFIASKIPLQETFIYLPTLIASFGKNFRFIQDRAIDIFDYKVFCENGYYEFDYLIIATGSVTKFLKGFKEKGRYSFGVKSLRAALKVKQFFEKELFDRLEITQAKKSFNIIVIGGGLSGIEIATEMKAYFNNYSKNNALTCKNINIKIISKHILKRQNKKVINKVLKRLKRLNVEIVRNYVKRIEENRAILDDNSSIDFDFAIFAGGIEPSPFIKNLNFTKNRKGFLVVDEFLRVDKNIFAIGDCAELLDRNKNIVPPTAQSAKQSGTIAAKNILRLMENKKLLKADIKLMGMAISLGGKYAIAITPMGVIISGFLGWIVKKLIEKYYKIPLKIKALKGYRKLKMCKKDYYENIFY